MCTWNLYNLHIKHMYFIFSNVTFFIDLVTRGSVVYVVALVMAQSFRQLMAERYSLGVSPWMSHLIISLTKSPREE